MKKKNNGKKLFWAAAGMCAAVFSAKQGTLQVLASHEPVIVSGVYVEGMDMSGMNREQAVSAIEDYVHTVLTDENLIYIQYEDKAECIPTGAELGGTWTNEEVVDALFEVGNVGNVVERYKMRKELERDNVDFDVDIQFSQEAVQNYIQDNFAQYDEEVQNMYLTREDGIFKAVQGRNGYEVDAETSAKEITDFLNEEWDRTRTYLSLEVSVVQPKGTTAELMEVKDLIGSYTTSFSGGTSEKRANISNGADLINGITMYPGEEFSFDAYAAPYTIANGYAVGKAYASGQLVDSVGGGICQVSSTLYNAVLRAELEVTMRYNHSMIVGYVPISADATLAETSGKDFRFINNWDTPIYIEAYVTSDSRLCINIYGKETRAANRTVEYVSETLEVINPGPDVINVSGSLPVGYIQVSSAYTGYKARLWKVVKVDGAEQSRELVNTSSYRAVARTATVGMNTQDPNVSEQMNAAVATGSIDHVRNVIAAVTAPTPQEGETE